MVRTSYVQSTVSEISQLSQAVPRAERVCKGISIDPIPALLRCSCYVHGRTTQSAGSRRNRRKSLRRTALPGGSVSRVHDLHHRFGVAQ